MKDFWLSPRYSNLCLIFIIEVYEKLGALLSHYIHAAIEKERG